MGGGLIVVTGGAGFIGSNLVRGLNAAGHENILVVDDLSDGRKFRNLADCNIHDYMDRSEFRRLLPGKSGVFPRGDIQAVFHQGACSDTMEWDGNYMLDNNYSYSRDVLEFCLARAVPFIYASSAAVYGASLQFAEARANECPINMYGYSKMLFDHHVRRRLDGITSQVAGLRYFNVYGPREQHKGTMASVAYHLNAQLLSSGVLKLFRGSGGYADGEQRRDFISVDDVVRVNLWLMQNPGVSGIYNVGTGKSRSFNEMARAVIDWHGNGRIEYIDMPGALRASYQSFTEADIGALRGAGYRGQFTPLEAGIGSYLEWLNAD